MLALHPKSQGRGLMVMITVWYFMVFLHLSSEEQRVAKLSLSKLFSSLMPKEMDIGILSILFQKLIKQ